MKAGECLRKRRRKVKIEWVVTESELSPEEGVDQPYWGAVGEQPRERKKGEFCSGKIPSGIKPTTLEHRRAGMEERGGEMMWD